MLYSSVVPFVFSSSTSRTLNFSNSPPSALMPLFFHRGEIRVILSDDRFSVDPVKGSQKTEERGVNSFRHRAQIFASFFPFGRRPGRPLPRLPICPQRRGGSLYPSFHRRRSLALILASQSFASLSFIHAVWWIKKILSISLACPPPVSGRAPDERVRAAPRLREKANDSKSVGAAATAWSEKGVFLGRLLE